MDFFWIHKFVKHHNGFLFEWIKIGNGFYRIHYSSLDEIMDPSGSIKL